MSHGVGSVKGGGARPAAGDNGRHLGEEKKAAALEQQLQQQIQEELQRQQALEAERRAEAEAQRLEEVEQQRQVELEEQTRIQEEKIDQLLKQGLATHLPDHLLGKLPARFRDAADRQIPTALIGTAPRVLPPATPEDAAVTKDGHAPTDPKRAGRSGYDQSGFIARRTHSGLRRPDGTPEPT